MSLTKQFSPRYLPNHLEDMIVGVVIGPADDREVQRLLAANHAKIKAGGAMMCPACGGSCGYPIACQQYTRIMEERRLMAELLASFMDGDRAKAAEARVKSRRQAVPSQEEL